MDGSAAIEWNREALKRIVAMLVDMAGLAEDADSPIPTRRPDDRSSPEGRTIADGSADPHSGLLRKPPLPLKGGEEERTASPPPLPLPHRSGERWSAKPIGVGVEFPCDGRHSEVPAEGGPRRAIPRRLWRAILALLRPAESAARRLIIAASAGLTVPPPRPRKAEPGSQTMEPLLRRLGIAIMAVPGKAAPILPRFTGEGNHAKRGGGGAPARRLSLPLFDPPRRLALYGHRRHTVPPHAAPRIFVPGITEPAHLPPPPSPDDLVSADHLTRRLAALTAALDDLPGQARRFARWKAARDAISAQERHRDALSAQRKESDTAGVQNESRDPATPRRTSPLRRGRPPGGRLSRYDPAKIHPPNIREVDEILAHAHSLALYALENPDTS